jgi:putative transposase
MTRKRHTKEQIIAVLKDAQAGVSVQNLCQKHSISDATFYKWRTTYAGLEVSDVKKLHQLEEENRRLKQRMAEPALDIQGRRRSPQQTGKAQGEEGCGTGCLCTLCAQRAAGVPVSGLDRNTLRYGSRRRDDSGLRTRIREIAERTRGDGCPWISVRLRREGGVNHKKVERAYREEGLALRRRARKNTTSVPRVALPLPSEPGRCYAMDFVHDRLATGRRSACFTMTDLCSKEVPVVEVDASIGGERVCRILDRLFAGRPGPWTVILDNGPEFAGTALDACGLTPLLTLPPPAVALPSARASNRPPEQP